MYEGDARFEHWEQFNNDWEGATKKTPGAVSQRRLLPIGRGEVPHDKLSVFSLG
jgi:hypothetical protein